MNPKLRTIVTAVSKDSAIRKATIKLTKQGFDLSHWKVEDILSLHGHEYIVIFS